MTAKKTKQTKEKLSLKVEKRNLFGRKVKKLRYQGLIPAVIYGHNFDSVAVQFPRHQLGIIKLAGETSVVYLELDSRKIPVMVKQVQYHPISGQVLHLDFYKVNLKEKVTTEVPIELTGEAPIAKEGYNIVQVLHEVEISALPTDIPKEIEVNISSLTKEGDDIRLKDIKLPGGKIEFAEGVDPEETVVIVEKPAEEEVEEVPEEAAAEETEEIKEAKKGEEEKKGEDKKEATAEEEIKKES